MIFDLEWSAIAFLVVAGAALVLWVAVRRIPKLARWLRWRWARARCSPVPEDGEQLNPDEARALRVITRGWKRPAAPEPAYDKRSRP